MQPNSQQGNPRAASPTPRLFKSSHRQSVRSYTGTESTLAPDGDGAVQHPRRATTALLSADLDPSTNPSGTRSHRLSMRLDDPDLSTHSSHSSLRSLFKGKGNADTTAASPNHTAASSAAQSISSSSGASTASTVNHHHSLTPVNALSRLKNSVIHHHRKHRKPQSQASPAPADSSTSMPQTAASHHSAESQSK